MNLKEEIMVIMEEMDEAYGGTGSMAGKYIFAVSRKDYPVLADKIVNLIEEK
jgi:hypothetical protein